jgi:hypothetical protein
MKIHIIAPEPPFTRGSQIRANGKTIQNIKAGVFPNDFDEAEIEFLLGAQLYEKAQNGQYEFDIPKWKLDVVSGNNNSAKREHLIFGND